MSFDETALRADDTLVPFQVGDSAVRGRLVRLGPLVHDILTRHDYAPAVSALLGEALALTALLGAALKFDGKLIFQAKGDGPVRFLVVDYISDGAMRGYASVDEARLGEVVAVEVGSPSPVAALLGKGHMALTIDQGPDMERYQGVTALEGESLAASALTYFDQSEQIPTAVKLAVGRVQRPGEGEVWRAGGVIAQFMPGEGGARERGEAALMAEEDEEMWRRAALLLDTTEADELIDPTVTPDQLLYRLYNEDGVRVFDPQAVRLHCSCNREKIAAVLAQYKADELQEMAEDGVIKVTCEFCSKTFPFDPAEAAGV